MTPKRTAGIIMGAILIGIGSWGIYRNTQQEETTTVSSVPDKTATSGKKVVVNIPGIDYGFVESASSSPSSAKPSMPAPSFSYPIVVPSSFSEESKASAVKTLTEIISRLKESPENASLWGELGLYRKEIADYKGSKEALEYSLALNPQNAVTADNLGVVYGYYLHEPKKAEQNFLLAIQLEPEVSYRYLRLFELYTYIIKDKAKAKALLERGLQAIPGEPSLKSLLESIN